MCIHFSIHLKHAAGSRSNGYQPVASRLDAMQHSQLFLASVLGGMSHLSHR